MVGGRATKKLTTIGRRSGIYGSSIETYRLQIPDNTETGRVALGNVVTCMQELTSVVESVLIANLLIRFLWLVNIEIL